MIETPSIPRKNSRLRPGIISTVDIYKKYVEEGGKLAYFAFRELIFQYNKEMVKECISTGNEWYVRGRMGIIKIGKIKRKISVTEDEVVKCAIDWGESNKLKKKIISRGELPLEVYKDEQGNKIGDNGGVPWLCYHTSNYYYRWLHSPDLFLKNGFKYKFSPSWGNTQSLSKSINDNSEFLYKLIEDKK